MFLIKVYIVQQAMPCIHLNYSMPFWTISKLTDVLFDLDSD